MSSPIPAINQPHRASLVREGVECLSRVGNGPTSAGQTKRPRCKATYGPGVASLPAPGPPSVSILTHPWISWPSQQQSDEP